VFWQYSFGFEQLNPEYLFTGIEINAFAIQLLPVFGGGGEPFPGIFVFQAIFVESFHFSGTFFSSDIPSSLLPLK
jgi:hypothetical protein